MSGGWMATAHEVWPRDDLRGHDQGEQCWCAPAWTDDGILVHVSMDRREDYERGRLLS